jgi:hypothetical protein
LRWGRSEVTVSSPHHTKNIFLFLSKNCRIVSSLSPPFSQGCQRLTIVFVAKRLSRGLPPTFLRMQFAQHITWRQMTHTQQQQKATSETTTTMGTTVMCCEGLVLADAQLEVILISGSHWSWQLQNEGAQNAGIGPPCQWGWNWWSTSNNSMDQTILTEFFQNVREYTNSAMQ